MLGEGFVVHARGHARFERLRDELLRGLHDVPAPAVVGGDGQREAGVARGLGLGALDQRADLVVEHGNVADDAQADAVGVQLADLAFERGDEKAHQERHFVGRTAPVLGTEREQRDEFDAAARAAFDGRANRVDAARVTGDARQAPLRRPTAIAVHDDRDVTRDSRDIGHGNGRAGIGHGR